MYQSFPLPLTFRLRAALLPAVFASLLFVALKPCEAASPPANDNLANAQVISTDSFSVAGTEVGATQESFEQSDNFVGTSGVDLNASVWYAWTPSAPGTLHISAVNTSTDGDVTAALLFQGPGTPTKSTYIAGTDPGETTFTANVTADQPYFFFVGNADFKAHSFILKGTFVPTGTPPATTTPAVTLTVKTPKVVRSTGVAGKVVFELSAASTNDLTVTYKTSGSAINGTDYKMLSGSVTLPAGATKATLKIKPRPDTSGTVSVKLSVTSGDGYTVGDSAKGKVKIVD